MFKNIKKIILFLFILFFILYTQKELFAMDIYYKNHLLHTDVKPFVKNGRTLVPISVIAHNMNADVKWNSNKKLVTIVKQNMKVHIEIGRLTMLVETNQKKEIIKLDVPAMIIQDRTMVPLRAISEIFGSDVKWDKTTNSILIDSDKNITLKNPKPKDKGSNLNTKTPVSKTTENLIIKNLENLPRVNYKIPELKIKIEDVSSNQRYISQITLLKKKLSGTYKAYNITSIKNPHYSLICYTDNTNVYIQEKSNDNKRNLAIYALPNYTIVTSPDFNYELESVMRSILMKNKKISKDDDLLIEQQAVSKSGTYTIQTIKVTMEDSIGSHLMGEYLVDAYNKTIIDFKTKKIIYSDSRKN